MYSTEIGKFQGHINKNVQCFELIQSREENKRFRLFYRNSHDLMLESGRWREFHWTAYFVWKLPFVVHFSFIHQPNIKPHKNGWQSKRHDLCYPFRIESYHWDLFIDASNTKRFVHSNKCFHSLVLFEQNFDAEINTNI